MVEPEIYEFLDWIVGVADELGLDPAAGGPRRLRRRTRRSPRTATGPTTSSCPACCSHAFQTGDARRARRPPRALTGAPVHDARLPRRHPGPARTSTGILEPREMRDLADVVVAPWRQRQPDPVRLARRRRRRPPAQLHVLLGARRRRRPVPRRAGHPALRARASRRSTTWACSRARTTTRRSSEPARAARSTATTTPRRDPGRARAAGGASAGAHPAAHHPPGVLRANEHRRARRASLCLIWSRRRALLPSGGGPRLGPPRRHLSDRTATSVIVRSRCSRSARRRPGRSGGGRVARSAARRALHDGIAQLVMERQEVLSHIGPWPHIGLTSMAASLRTPLCQQVDFESPRLPVCSRCRQRMHPR